MLAELRLLFAAVPAEAASEQYRCAILEENVLLKKTLATRRESLRRLRALYALDPRTLLFRSLRDLWVDDGEAQPILALLCATARDPILRMNADFVLSITVNDSVAPQMISEAVNQSYPGRFNPMTLANFGRHLASSWQQAGHLCGRLKKVRARAICRPAAVAYALLLGHLCDARGETLFNTLWAQLLDAPMNVLHEQAQMASRRGWIEYRQAGGVTDVSFSHLLREKGREYFK
jgi:hypothetical protein